MIPSAIIYEEVYNNEGAFISSMPHLYTIISTLRNSTKSYKVSLGVAKLISDRLLNATTEKSRLIQVQTMLWKRIENDFIEIDFDDSSYLEVYPDVHDKEITPSIHWKLYGLNEGRIPFGSQFPPNRKIAFYKHDSEIDFINVFGPFTLSNGLGEAARGYLASLEKLNCVASKIDISGLIHDENLIDIIDPLRMTGSINIFILTPDLVLKLIKRYSTSIFLDYINIGVWVWELPAPRPEWTIVYNLFQHIICPSVFCADAFSKVYNGKISVIPHALEHMDQVNISEENNHSTVIEFIEKNEDRLVILFVFDGSSYAERKGYDNSIELINILSEKHKNNFIFIIKTHSFTSPEINKMKLKNNVYIVNEYLSRKQYDDIRTRADLYISPHRSEGFGLNVFEMIYIGTPVIFPKYAGASELLDDNYPFFCDYKLSVIEEDIGPYRSGSIWCECQIDSIVLIVEKFMVDPTFYKNKMHPYMETLRSSCSYSRVGGSFIESINSIGNELRNSYEKINRKSYFDHEDKNIIFKNIKIENIVHPVFSFITPVYNTKLDWLIELYYDICSQEFKNWEWCIVDDGTKDESVISFLKELRNVDPRVKIHFNDINSGISAATNKAVYFSTGKWLVLVDHDDRIDSKLLSYYKDAIELDKKVAVIYCDEDKILPNGEYGDDFFKPNFSPEYLLSTMYILHCLAIRKDIFLRLGGYRSEFDGAQDHDFLLRCHAEYCDIHHVPICLYHWRISETSTASNPQAKPLASDAGARSVSDYLKSINIPATVEQASIPGIYRVRPFISGNLVSLLILTAGKYDNVFGRRVLLVENFVNSILDNLENINIEIVIVFEHGQEDVGEKVSTLSPLIRCFYWSNNGSFNFSKKANIGVSFCHGESIILLNDDMQVITKGWISALLEMLELPEVGVVGGKLLYSDNSIQHAGVILGLQGTAGHLFRFAHDNYIGYNGFTHVIRNYSAVTGALFAFRKDTFNLVGGFDESFPLDFNDIDFCLRVTSKGLRVVYTPYSKLYHFESRSAVRYVQDPLDRLRFAERWNISEPDPYFNKHLSLTSVICLRND